jgi:hypothetical protein
MANPIHHTPSSVMAMLTVSARGEIRVSPNRTGTSTTATSRTWYWVP